MDVRWNLHVLSSGAALSVSVSRRLKGLLALKSELLIREIISVL